jgi:antirestriction protein ArdC
MSDDIYTRVTETICEALEKGVRPWAPSWDRAAGFGAMPVRATGETYRGVNVLLLWGSSLAQGFDQPRWMTFKQALEQGGNVRKGEKGTRVVYAGRIVREGEGGEALVETRAIPFLKGYTVFNVQQVEGLGPEWFTAAPEPRPEPARDAEADAFFAAVGADVRHGGGRAFYSRDADAITLPPLAAFHDAEAYYATRAHETVHWTGHEKRLAREFGKRFGDKAYAAEELVAEIGAAFICATIGVSVEPREDHAAYVADWLKVLKGDKRAIFTAASAAQAATDYLRERATPAALAA